MMKLEMKPEGGKTTAVKSHYEPQGESIKTPKCQESEIKGIDSFFTKEMRKKTYKSLILL
jgi:hypothetical protein